MAESEAVCIKDSISPKQVSTLPAYPETMFLSNHACKARILFPSRFPYYHSNFNASSQNSSADFFITASTSETQGLTTLEALAHSVPVIGAQAMATPEYIKDNYNGYLFKPGSIKKLVDIVKKSSVPEKEMKKNALKTAKKFTIEKCTNKLEKVYEKSINNFKK